MKVRQIVCIACTALLALPMLASAEIYKWKDKEGVTRYTDTPPPSNIKQESIGKKKVVSPTSKAPLSPVETAAGKPAAAGAAAKPVKGEKALETAESAEEKAATERQRDAEQEKKNKEIKEADAKAKAENCRSAKSNYETYKQGGRISKVNEKGEKSYLGDKEIADGAAKAQQDVQENCS